MKKNPSKQKVMEAASFLFFQKGFHGTSVRDIAERACVNVSLISYYFKSKQGLLEHGVTQYYEQYLSMMEETLKATANDTALSRLKKLIESIIHYRQNNLQFSCFILRELSLDSVFVREMAVTYIAKENYYISNSFFATLTKEQKREQDLLLMQLKGLLVTPYILQNEWKNQVVGDYSHQMFVQKYVKNIHKWLDFIVEQPIDSRKGV